MMKKTDDNENRSWHFNRQVNLSVLVQLVLLASLILGSWVNLQRQLDLLQRDVTILLDNQNKFESRIEGLAEKGVEHEYRLRAVENRISGIAKKTYHNKRVPYMKIKDDVCSILYDKVLSDLCPEGTWKFRDVIEKILKSGINRYPRLKVSDEEAKYPTTPAGMRAFLDVFFARHYFQVQNSLIQYMTSEDFLNQINNEKIVILDIGSGPAVASLAITEILASVLTNLKELDIFIKPVKIAYTLNDTSLICLGVGQQFIQDYFRRNSSENLRLVRDVVLSIEKCFPSNIDQLRRISKNLGQYSLVNLSYVINPLNDIQGFNSLVDGITGIETITAEKGRILIVQDKYSEKLVRKIAKAIGQSCMKDVVKQYVYSEKNGNEAYSYLYYFCLFEPGNKKVFLSKV